MNKYILVFILSFIITFYFSSVSTSQSHIWSVPSSHDIEKLDVTFENSGLKLSGTLFSPKGVQNGSAVIVVQQASTKTRDNPLFVQIAETFTSIGYSVFLYDRRGYGASEGSTSRPSYTTMALDAVAAKKAIGQTDKVHPRKIGFWGLSQGGWIAMEAATISNPAFVISVSAPLTTPGEQMNFLSYNYILTRYNEEAALQALEARQSVMNEYFVGEISYDSASSILNTIENEPWFKYAFMPSSDELPVNVEETSWINEMKYNPIPAYNNVKAPLLFILGGEDMDIPVKRTLEITVESGQHPKREIVVIPEANHLMRIGDDPNEDYDLEDGPILSNSDKYFLKMGEWIGRLNLNK